MLERDDGRFVYERYLYNSKNINVSADAIRVESGELMTAMDASETIYVFFFKLWRGNQIQLEPWTFPDKIVFRILCMQPRSECISIVLAYGYSAFVNMISLCIRKTVRDWRCHHRDCQIFQLQVCNGCCISTLWIMAAGFKPYASIVPKAEIRNSVVREFDQSLVIADHQS
jgi:hypothetical protein